MPMLISIGLLLEALSGVTIPRNMAPANRPGCRATAMHGRHESGLRPCPCRHITAAPKAVNLGPKANIALSYRGHRIREVSAFKRDDGTASASKRYVT